MSLHVIMMLSGLLLVLSGLGTMALQHKEPPAAPPPVAAPESRRETWDVLVRLYLPDAQGRLEKIGGYILKHGVDKASALAYVAARNSAPEALDAEIKAFLFKHEYPPNVFYVVEPQVATNMYSVAGKYKPRVPLTESSP